MLVAGASCNSLLGIEEASLSCDEPPCGLANPVGMPAGNETPASGEAGASDGGAALDNANGGANAVGNGDLPVGSGVPGEGVPVVPSFPPPSVDPDDMGSGTGGTANGGSGAEAEPSSAGAAGTGGAGGAAGTGGAVAGAGGAATGSSGAAGEAGDACGTGDPCGACLCTECEAVLGACTSTPGCLEILACARNSGCTGFSCYCGTVDLFACATTAFADGPCRAVMLAAPGAHPPNLADANAGPASEAALDLATCSRQSCVMACGG
jgi:hypothetical protein